MSNKNTETVLSGLDCLSHLLVHWREWIEMSRKERYPDFHFTDDYSMNQVITPCGVTTRQFKEWVKALDEAMEHIKELSEDNDELNFSFNLRWKADIRAIKKWQIKTGKKLRWPDHADLCVYLMDELDKKRFWFEKIIISILAAALIYILMLDGWLF